MNISKEIREAMSPRIEQTLSALAQIIREQKVKIEILKIPDLSVKGYYQRGRDWGYNEAIETIANLFEG